MALRVVGEEEQILLTMTAGYSGSSKAGIWSLGLPMRDLDYMWFFLAEKFHSSCLGSACHLGSSVVKHLPVMADEVDFLS